jgi:GAF domain-containing protein
MNVFRQFDSDDVSVVISELLIATADSSDALLDGSVNEVLRALRERLKLDVVFVSEFVDGQRVFRFVDRSDHAPALRAGDANPLEETFCQRVVDGRLPGLIKNASALPGSFDLPPVPFPVGAHLSTPIVMKDGRAYGTLCCFSSAPNQALRDKDLQTLKHCAQLVARKLELADAQGIQDPPANWALEPIDKYESKVWKLP